MKYYLKFLGNDRQPCHGGIGQWPEPLTWTESIENPIPCHSGYHLCRKQDFFRWCHAPTLWIVEAEGVLHTYDKVVAKRARLIRQVGEWSESNRRLFSADCAERVLKHFESICPDDKRLRAALETTRRFAIGQATVAELASARLDAEFALDYISKFVKWSAAMSAARSAVRTVLDVVLNSGLEAVVGSAVVSAGAAAGSAAVSAAVSAEREWQITHLLTNYLKLNPEDFE